MPAGCTIRRIRSVKSAACLHSDHSGVLPAALWRAKVKPPSGQQNFGLRTLRSNFSGAAGRVACTVGLWVGLH